MNDLPRELQDRICWFLDTHSASACSLLCRRWSPAARSRLFNTVRIRDHPLTSRIKAFTDFVQTDSFSAYNFGRSIYTLDIAYGLLNIFVSQIARLLPYLRVLRVLRLTSIRICRDLSLVEPIRNGTNPPFLNSLHLINVGFVPSPSRSTNDTVYACSSVDLLSLFSSIRVLDLNDSGLNNHLAPIRLHSFAEVEALGVQHPGKPCVQSLEFHGDQYQGTAIINVLGASGQLNGLQKLTLSVGVVDADNILRCLIDVHTLRDVTVHMQSAYRSTVSLPSLPHFAFIDFHHPISTL